MEEMATWATEPKPCRHPAITARDNTQSARVGDQSAARHSPFVYFHSIIDTPSCAANDVPLERMPIDLASIATTPNYAFIAPNLCHDGHDPDPTSASPGETMCVDGQPGQLAAVDGFLRRWVPQILDSPAFKKDGLLMVTFDEAEATSSGDSSNVPNSPTPPNPFDPGGRQPGPAGGNVGAVLISPFITPGTTSEKPYNHFGQLRTFEDLFGLAHLGWAARPEFQPFGSDVFNLAAASGPGSVAGAGSPRIRISGIRRPCARSSF